MRPLPRLAFLAWLAAPALAEPAPPTAGPELATLKAGVFCALQAMDQTPAPGTLSGWIHVPEGEIDFHWPDRQVVPAALGLAFGVKARLAPGLTTVDAQMRVYRPGSDTPEYWASGFSEFEESFAFFRFDTEAELVTGTWRFEAWQGEQQLYSVAFDVVPAAAVPELVEACGAVS